MVQPAAALIQPQERQHGFTPPLHSYPHPFMQQQQISTNIHPYYAHPNFSHPGYPVIARQGLEHAVLPHPSSGVGSFVFITDQFGNQRPAYVVNPVEFIHSSFPVYPPQQMPMSPRVNVIHQAVPATVYSPVSQIPHVESKFPPNMHGSHHDNFSRNSDDAELKEQSSKRKRGKVGQYKRRKLQHLLLDNVNFKLVEQASQIKWPEMNTVYLCADWRTLDPLHPHVMRKLVGFSQGSYTQSRIKWNGSTWEIRQSKCAGVRKCTNCGKDYPRNTRRAIRGMASLSQGPSIAMHCSGSLALLACQVTLYYMFPSSGNDSSMQIPATQFPSSENDNLIQISGTQSNDQDGKPSALSELNDNDHDEDVDLEETLASAQSSLSDIVTSESRLLICIPGSDFQNHSHSMVGQ